MTGPARSNRIPTTATSHHDKQNDQKEGMAAFVEKRKPKFTNT